MADNRHHAETKLILDLESQLHDLATTHTELTALRADVRHHLPEHIDEYTKMTEATYAAQRHLAELVGKLQGKVLENVAAG